MSLLYQLGYREMPYEMQQQIMNPFGYGTKKWNHVSQNARPFTSFEPKDPKDAEYWTLTKGMFKEVWEPTAQETYGHFTITTETGRLKVIDTTNHKGQLIDPVAFAYDFGARIYDARVGRFLSVDPLTNKQASWSPYVAFNNNPILNIDNDGNYSVAVHYNITYNTLIQLGYSKAIADNIAHHASVFADHPEQVVLNIDNALHGSNNSYRPSLNYSKTKFSQAEWHSDWHSMMSNKEAESGMTHEQAVQRGLSFGWSNIFAQQEKEDIDKLGQGIHALQDAYAHNGASTDEHLGVNNYGIYNESARDMLYNDAFGNTNQAEQITKSAGTLLQMFKGNTSSLQNGMSFNFTGLSAKQLTLTQNLFKKAGYSLNAGKDKGTYTIQKNEKK